MLCWCSPRSITTFNEWGEGTQIEPAVGMVVTAEDGVLEPRSGQPVERMYPPYRNFSAAGGGAAGGGAADAEDAEYYLRLTAQHAALFRQQAGAASLLEEATAREEL